MDIRIEDAYAKICETLADRRVYRLAASDFDELCSGMGLVPKTMDNMLYERLGMSGEDILETLRYDKLNITC